MGRASQPSSFGGLNVTIYARASGSIQKKSIEKPHWIDTLGATFVCLPQGSRVRPETSCAVDSSIGNDSPLQKILDNHFARQLKVPKAKLIESWWFVRGRLLRGIKLTGVYCSAKWGSSHPPAKNSAVQNLKKVTNAQSLHPPTSNLDLDTI